MKQTPQHKTRSTDAAADIAKMPSGSASCGSPSSGSLLGDTVVGAVEGSFVCAACCCDASGRLEGRSEGDAVLECAAVGCSVGVSVLSQHEK